MKLESDHAAFLSERLKQGEIVLVLGAGAAYGSQSRDHQDLLDGKGLATFLASEMGAAWDNEPLSEVVSAFEHTAGTPTLHTILQRKFRHSKPSDTLNKLMNYTWKRLYTFNIDDSLVEASRQSVQRVSHYNGMDDKVEDLSFLEDLQMVFLHGMVSKLDKGVILSDQDYTKALQSRNHAWYAKAAEDYRAHCPVFIGSMLAEPILHMEINRASREDKGRSGLAFLITPDRFSTIRKRAFLSKGIVHVEATVQQFAEWVSQQVGDTMTPSAIVAEKNSFTGDIADRFTADDIAAAQSLQTIDPKKITATLAGLAGPSLSRKAERFLIGFPPDWIIAASEVPVKLEILTGLKRSMSTALQENEPIFVVTGQAGSGKTTAAMQAALDINAESKGAVEIYELSTEAASVSKSLSVLKRLNDRKKIVFISSLFAFGGRLKDDLQAAKDANVMFLTTARSSEWGEHFARYFGAYPSFPFQRFGKNDYQPLVDRISRYVPAPRFRKLTPTQRIEKLAKSKSQLLIALREATLSKNFEEIIVDEFEGLPDQDVKDLFYIVGAATLARVGIRKEIAAEAYLSSKRQRSFEAAFAALEGIVSASSTGRLLARHEFYVRKIFDQRTSRDQLFNALTSIIDTYLIYEMPVMRHVSRSDGALLRYLLSHRSLREQGEALRDREFGLDIYARYTVPLQLEGHYWLQYGLYEAGLGRTDEAAAKLRKSFDAHPGNPFTSHALASLQLKQAQARNSFDSVTRAMILDSVKILERMAAQTDYEFDHYPLVTLAKQHVATLVKHDQRDDARRYAKDYYDRLRELDRYVRAPDIKEAMTILLKFLSTGEWPSGHMSAV